ncbi:MAG TPA: hypothetical protein VFT06_07910, partial [Flavisolibacter sp.]|nr:hypothetical protein [Flavisolibacter sp.]
AFNLSVAPGQTHRPSFAPTSFRSPVVKLFISAATMAIPGVGQIYCHLFCSTAMAWKGMLIRYASSH